MNRKYVVSCANLVLSVIFLSSLVIAFSPKQANAYQALPTDPDISGTVYVVSANEDKALKVVNGRYINGLDYKWYVSINSAGSSDKMIERMTLIHSAIEGWSTDNSADNPINKSLWALGTSKSASCGTICQVDSYYTYIVGITVPAKSSKDFFVYGFTGAISGAVSLYSGDNGYLLVEFTDFTSAIINLRPLAPITPNPAKQGAVVTINGSNFTATGK